MADIKIIIDTTSLVDAKKKLSAFQTQMGKTNSVLGLTRALSGVESNVKELVAAQNKGQLSGRTFKQGLLEQRKALEAMGLSSYKAKQRVEQLANETKKAQAHINQMGKSSNRAGAAMQQTGYQVGDFVVQVQGGTNPMVAFGQQATQLVGVLYLLPPATLAATKTIFGLSVSVNALVMSLGIAVPILAAIGAAYLRFKKESDKAGKAASELAERINSLKESLKSYKREKLAEGLGITVDQLVARNAVTEAKKRLEEVKQEYLDTMSSSNPITAFKFLFDAFNPATTGLDTTAEQDAIIEAKQRVLDVEKRLADQQRKRYNEQKFHLDQEEEMLLLISAYGEDHDKVKKLRLEQEIEARQRTLEAQRTSLELKGEDVTALKAQVALILRIAELNKEAAEQARLDALGDEAILQNQADAELALMQENAKYEAGQAAIRLREQTELNDLVEEMATRLAIPFAQALGLIRQAKLEASVGLDAFGGGGDYKYDLPSTFTPPKKTKTNSKGLSPAEELAKLLAGKEKELALEKSLVGLFNEERDIQTALFNAKDKYSEVITKQQLSELEGTLLQIEAEKKRQAVLEEAQAKQASVIQTLESGMETVMMSMIDGTKSVGDAFKAMASEVIKELYRIYVVKKIVGMVTGTWDALGSVGAPSMGGKVANGGPVSGGRSYLVGERGPEMFTPSMGGGHITPASQTNAGGVTIVQNINVSTGVQQTVRAEIRQMMPQIAQSAKGAVLDAKRRGGSYGSAFA